MKRRNGPLLKFAAFAVVMLLLSGLLLMVFGDYRSGARAEYAAIFADSSGLRAGDTVRVAGVEVGSVREVTLRADHSVRVTFDAERTLALTEGTALAVRYLNLVGDRYLELTEPPVVTQAEFLQIQNGMSYEEVQRIIGAPGQEMSRSDVAGINTVMYQWINRGGSNMNAMFQNGKLVQKAQFGLQ